MTIQKKDKKRAARRAFRVRSHLRAVTTLPRVSVFRSLNHIYAQLIDDAMHTTIASCSSLVVDEKAGDKTAVAHKVGLELAKRIKEKGITDAAFDRGQFRYHGRIKALVEGLREGGINI